MAGSNTIEDVRLQGNPRGQAGSDHLPVLLLVPLAALLVVEMFASMRWRLGHDVPLLHYVALTIDKFGFVPYRDIFDMNFPGAYLFHMLIGRTLGYGDLAARVTDLLMLITLSGLTWAILHRLGRWIAPLAIVFFGLSYFQLGPFQSLQREYAGLLPVTAAVLIASRGRPGIVRALVVGLCFGLAATIKPHLAIGLPLVLAYMVPGGEDSQAVGTGQTWKRRAVLLGLAGCVGAALPLLAVFGWLWKIGALPYFLDIARGYLPLYLQMNGSHVTMSGPERTMHLVWNYRTLGNWTPLLIPAFVGAHVGLFHAGLEDRLRRLVLLLMGLLGVYSIYPMFSGQFWPYHWIPFQYFASAAAPLALLVLRSRTDTVGKTWLAVIALAWAAGLTLWPSPRLSEDLSSRPVESPLGPDLDAIVRYLEPRLQPGDTVQPLQWTGPAVSAMLQLEARIGTRFLYDFVLYHNVSNPYIQNLRREFLAEMQTRKPRFVVYVIATPRPSGPDSSLDFPELRQLLTENYSATASSKNYVIFERNTPADPQPTEDAKSAKPPTAP